MGFAPDPGGAGRRHGLHAADRIGCLAQVVAASHGPSGRHGGDRCQAPSLAASPGGGGAGWGQDAPRLGQSPLRALPVRSLASSRARRYRESAEGAGEGSWLHTISKPGRFAGWMYLSRSEAQREIEGPVEVWIGRVPPSQGVLSEAFGWPDLCLARQLLLIADAAAAVFH